MEFSPYISEQYLKTFVTHEGLQCLAKEKKKKHGKEKHLISYICQQFYSKWRIFHIMWPHAPSVLTPGSPRSVAVSELGEV